VAAHRAGQCSGHQRRRFTISRTLIIPLEKGTIMTLCPIAIIAGCKKCPAFSMCPLKTVIGDQPKEADLKATSSTKK
jgi:hypothetical protein